MKGYHTADGPPAGGDRQCGRRFDRQAVHVSNQHYIKTECPLKIPTV